MGNSESSAASKKVIWFFMNILQHKLAISKIEIRINRKIISIYYIAIS